MGLEAVEIVMKVEETFDVVIEDSEAEKIVTPGQLIDLVMSKVGRTQDAACLTQRAFHRLKASLIRQMGLKREQIRPEVRLSDLFPRPTRKQQIQQTLGDIGVAKNLELIRPDWLTNSIRAAILLEPVMHFVLELSVHCKYNWALRLGWRMHAQDIRVMSATRSGNSALPI